MANRKNNKKNNGQKTKAPASKSKRKGTSLSPAAMAYRKMVMDPCNGPLVLPPLTGGTGHVIRLRTVVSWADIKAGATADMPYTFFIFDPMLGQYGHKQVLTNTTAFNTAAGASASTGNAITYTSAPDLSFLVGSNVRRYRPLAACLQFNNYTASNSVAGGIAPITELGYQGSRSVGTVATWNDICENLEYERMPLKHEVFWRPSDTPSWTNYNTVASAGAFADIEDTSSIGFAFRTQQAGAAYANIDMDVVITAIYEYEPEGDLGIAKSNRSSTITETVTHIVSTIPDEFWNYGKSVLSGFGKSAMQSLIGAPTPYQQLLM